uniref:HMG box domain-containing protein n=2 Tax=Wuchereria bancrofti TaxID=6293 RepID=A0AAF5PI13_WUCBA
MTTLLASCYGSCASCKQFPDSMFSFICNLRQISLAKITSAIRCYAAVKAAGSHGKFGRLPPGFGKITPFSLFIKENFASRKNEQPTEVFSNLTKEWKNLDEFDKRKYVDGALRINEEKRSKFELLDETEKEELHRRAKNLKEARLKRRIRLERRKKREINGQPSMSGWMLFVKEKAVKGVADSGKKQQDIIRELAIVWKSLPESDKDAYNKRAKALSKNGEICE